VHWYSANCRKNDEEIRHSSDGIRWKISYLQYLEFTKEDRNVRFALIIDGMNPLEENKIVYNTRSMILVMYNLLTWLCHKRKYLMLYILIQGLKRTGIDIDVFLEDMTKMWNEGVRTGVFHAICHHICYCHWLSMTLYAIRQMKGKQGCVICVDGSGWLLAKMVQVVLLRERQSNCLQYSLTCQA
jgi:hypothetical protein